MDTGVIAAAAAAMGGTPGEALTAFCAAARGELRARLKAGATEESCGETFVTAAALAALALELDTRAAQGESAYRAGQVSVTRRGAGERGDAAARLRRQAELLLAPYLTDGEVLLRGVRG